MQAVELAAQFNRAPEEAVSIFLQKGLVLSQRWTDVWQEAHARSFTVAGIARLDLLQDVFDALAHAMNSGESYASFKDRLIPILQAKGWWGKAVDAATGEITETLNDRGQPAVYGTPRRLKTIFQTNLQSAYMAGRHQGMLRSTDTHPYWQYVAVLDFRTRDSHAAMHGKVFRFDDPIWRTHYPPNGYNCRCRVRPLSQHALNDEKLALSSSAGQLREAFVPVSRRDPTRGHQPVTVFQSPEMPHGFAPDPGFNFNPARVAFQPELDRYDYRVARQYVQGVLAGPEFAGWYRKMEAAVAEKLADGDATDKIRRDLAQGQRFPVAVLDKPRQEQLGSQTHTVWLSDDTLAKQLINRGNQSIDLAEYWRVQEVLEHPSHTLDEREFHLRFLMLDGKWWVAVVKVTRDGKELWLQSFYQTGNEEVRRLLRKHEGSGSP